LKKNELNRREDRDSSLPNLDHSYNMGGLN
jgi:hypothetical protein